jgi:SNF2 family DNA or RNA helicase
MSKAEERGTERAWDPHIPGQTVRLRDNPGRQGKTTGRTKQAGSFLMAEVDFGPNEKLFKRYDLLELVEVEEEMFDLLGDGRFGGPIDLRRILTFEKVKGDLTNVFYSMEASNTDFYPHQFKPVLKFIESPVGRLLIADEVGLGKTIESIYIWKELQARQDARRLLVVCPAMLREKWRSDLKKRFNISGEIASSKHLLERVTELAERGGNDSFVYIVSLEGLRPPADFEDEKKTSTRARFARLLDQNTATDEFALFDLVILDEAHYLRNPATANNRLGRLLREAAHHMVLLTATPIQIASDNLYQLLRLIDPDEFYDSFLFSEVLTANTSVVRALRSLWRLPPDIGTATEAINEALSNAYFADDAVLKRVAEQVATVGSDAAKRVELVRLLEARSLIGQYMTRSRKREVLERKVERAAQVLNVRFSDLEREIYSRVTEKIRVQSAGKSGVSLFALIARQRQMASSLVAALESWREKGILEELLWEDLGRSLRLDQQQSSEVNINDTSADDIFSGLGSEGDETAPGTKIDLDALEAADGKYGALRDFLKGELEQNTNEKFVVFAFYRGTLRYLARRLKRDGIRAGLIMGAMGDAKDEILREFALADGPSVLLSSEVGSEGIDLQFCRFIVNYDLPWNPMRVEQRIGRLDRLGQKAERVSIINLALLDTIEDRILLRLYNRIALFRESIGDLEEILGDMTERLMLEMLNPELSDDERDRRARETEMAILNSRAEQDRLEQEAVNLIGFSDYILDHIKESRDKGRWLSADELTSLVEDFFARKYPGTKLEEHGKVAFALRIRLSEEARTSLAVFIAETKPATRTRLHQAAAPILCLFDPRQTEEFSRDVELIDPTHPLIHWIRADYAKDDRQLHPISAVKLDAAKVPVSPGDYVFVAHRWSFVGLRSDQVLTYRAVPVGAAGPLDGSASEDLVVAAARHGRTFANAANLLGDLAAIKAGALTCEEALGREFEERMHDFEAENELRCNQQETGARKFADRRIAELEERLARFRAQGNLRPIPMTEGLLRKEEAQLKAKLARVTQRRLVDPTIVPLASGVIRVE